jgi:uncharacterized protein YndB with AHSA1/START domain
MPREIHTDILINADPEKIWKILTDFDNYPNWNPFIRSVKGKVARGNYISVMLTPPGMRG